MSSTINQALRDSDLDPLDARALLRHVLGADDAYLISRGNQPLANAQIDLFSVLVRRRKAGEPVAYIIGMREFFSLEFKVTPAVLIPRPETELLVEFALECIAPERVGRVLDLGTGSGCIAISIAHQRPCARIVAVDTSRAALAVAWDNAQRLLGTLSKTPSPSGGKSEARGLWDGGNMGTTRDVSTPLSKAPSPLTGEGWDGGDLGDVGATRGASTPTLTLPHQGGGRVWFVQSDWFSALARRKFDLIVANPPYVAAGDSHLTGELRFEPRSALVAGADGLEHIRLIVAAAPRHLDSGGWLAFEHGYDQSASSRELLSQSGFARVFSRADLAGIERLSAGQWNARS